MGREKIKYKKILPCIWNDQKFRSLSSSGKLTFFYLLTHPAQTNIGTIRTTVRGLSFEEKDISHENLAEVFASRMAIESNEAPLIFLPNFLKYNPPENPNVAISWGKSLRDMPSCVVRDYVFFQAQDLLKDFSKEYLKGFVKGFTKGYPKELNKELVQSETVTEAIKIHQYSNLYTHVREEVDGVVHPDTGEVYYEN